MIGVAFDLRRASLVAFHQDAPRVTADEQGSREKKRPARNDLLLALFARVIDEARAVTSAADLRAG